MHYASNRTEGMGDEAGARAGFLENSPARAQTTAQQPHRTRSTRNPFVRLIVQLSAAGFVPTARPRPARRSKLGELGRFALGGRSRWLESRGELSDSFRQATGKALSTVMVIVLTSRQPRNLVNLLEANSCQNLCTITCFPPISLEKQFSCQIARAHAGLSSDCAFESVISHTIDVEFNALDCAVY